MTKTYPLSIQTIEGEDWDGDEYGVYHRSFIQSYHSYGHHEPVAFLEAVRAFIGDDEEELELLVAHEPRHIYMAGHTTEDGSEVWETRAPHGAPVTIIEVR